LGTVATGCCVQKKEEGKNNEKMQQQKSSRKAKNINDRKGAVRRDTISMKQMVSACRGGTCFGILELHGFDAEGIFSRP